VRRPPTASSSLSGRGCGSKRPMPGRVVEPRGVKPWRAKPWRAKPWRAKAGPAEQRAPAAQGTGAEQT
jgi:hypothetical protein